MKRKNGGQSGWARRDDKMSRDKHHQTSMQHRVMKRMANAKRRRRDQKGNDE